jgi:type IV pilus assembly protein PilZ
VFLLLTLLGESEKIPVAARVIWVTPRAAGIGVQFHEQDGERTRRKIEAYLAGVMAGDKPTHTM